MVSLEDSYFLRILQSNNFSFIKYYYKENSKNIPRPMLYAVVSDNLQFAKWLMKRYPETNLNKYDDLCFRLATKYNSTKIIYWLLSFKPDLGANNSEAFHNIVKNYQDWMANINIFRIFLDNREFTEKYFGMLLEKSLTISQKYFPLSSILFIKYLRKLEEFYPDLFMEFFTRELLENIVKKYRMIFYKFVDFEEYINKISANNVIKNDINWLENKVINSNLPFEVDNGVIRKVVFLDREKEETLCFICSNENIQMQTNCDHNFCRRCIYRWLERKDTCPFCRTEIKELLHIRLI